MLEDIKKTLNSHQSPVHVHSVNHIHPSGILHSLRTWAHRVALSGVMLAIYCGVIVASIPALKDALFHQISVIR